MQGFLHSVRQQTVRVNSEIVAIEGQLDTGGGGQSELDIEI